jgi:hypothetical protein
LAEFEFPFGFVAVDVGRKQVQDGWVGIDQMLEFEFAAEHEVAR